MQTTHSAITTRPHNHLPPRGAAKASLALAALIGALGAGLAVADEAEPTPTLTYDEGARLLEDWFADDGRGPLFDGDRIVLQGPRPSLPGVCVCFAEPCVCPDEGPGFPFPDDPPFEDEGGETYKTQCFPVKLTLPGMGTLECMGYGEVTVSVLDGPTAQILSIDCTQAPPPTAGDCPAGYTPPKPK